MVQPLDRFEYVAFWRRVGVALLDVVLLYGPIIVISYSVESIGLSVRWRTPIPYLLESALYSLPSLFFVMRFGGTPGKLILKMRIVQADGKYLRLGRAIRRDVFNYLFLAVDTVKLHLFIQGLKPGETFATSEKAAAAYWLSGGDYLLWSFLAILVLSGVDIITVALNRRKRAIHDYIAGSYVITKRSYDSLYTPLNEPRSGSADDALPAAGA